VCRASANSRCRFRLPRPPTGWVWLPAIIFMSLVQLAAVAINTRRNAALNPKAVYREPLSMEQYLKSRMVSTPLCLYDCDVPVDGSTVLIVSHRDTTPGIRWAT
jgi:acetyl-CoA acetyltransferase